MWKSREWSMKSFRQTGRGESSEKRRALVEAARERQMQQYAVGADDVSPDGITREITYGSWLCFTLK